MRLSKPATLVHVACHIWNACMICMVIFQDSIFVEMGLFYREANSYQAIVSNTWRVRIFNQLT